MAIGINEQRINQATICELVEESLNRRLIAPEHIKVHSVVQPGQPDVTIIRVEKKLRGVQPK